MKAAPTNPQNVTPADKLSQTSHPADAKTMKKNDCPPLLPPYYKNIHIPQNYNFPFEKKLHSHTSLH